jgi:SAM-dependent methyltransferase
VFRHLRRRQAGLRFTETRMKSMALPIPAGRLANLLPLLRCPRTGSELGVDEDLALVAEGGPWRYPVVDGVPVLIDEDRSLMDVSWIIADRPEPIRADAPRPGPAASLLGRARGLWPSTDRNVAAGQNYRRLVELLRVRSASGRRPRVLVVGGQADGAVSEELLDCAELQVIETGVAFGPRTDVVCDCHDLPFGGGSFDAVVIPSVLECVIYPQRVVSEVHRVLADDGIVYSEAGFIRQAHTGALDFNRYTHLGHRRLWRYFDEVDSGAQCGPAMALLWSTEYFFRAVAGRSRRARGLVSRAVALGGFWLKYLDGFLARRPGGIDAASGTFFLGTRRETPLSDRSLVAGFRGVLPPGQRLPAARAEPDELAGALAGDEINLSRGIRIRRRDRSTSGV